MTIVISEIATSILQESAFINNGKMETTKDEIFDQRQSRDRVGFFHIIILV